MILYYGLTNEKKEFTLLNLAKITTPENLKALGLALLLSLVSTAICLILAYPLAMILASKRHESNKFYRLDLHPPDVDEFPAAYPCMADIA